MMRNTDSEDKGGRERPDLTREYRPIGIGAVAAAVSAANKDPGQPERRAENCNERFGASGSRAA